MRLTASLLRAWRWINEDVRNQLLVAGVMAASGAAYLGVCYLLGPRPASLRFVASTSNPSDVLTDGEVETLDENRIRMGDRTRTVEGIGRWTARRGPCQPGEPAAAFIRRFPHSDDYFVEVRDVEWTSLGFVSVGSDRVAKSIDALPRNVLNPFGKVPGHYSVRELQILEGGAENLPLSVLALFIHGQYYPARAVLVSGGTIKMSHWSGGHFRHAKLAQADADPELELVIFGCDNRPQNGRAKAYTFCLTVLDLEGETCTPEIKQARGSALGAPNAFYLFHELPQDLLDDPSGSKFEVNLNRFLVSGEPGVISVFFDDGRRYYVRDGHLVQASLEGEHTRPLLSKQARFPPLEIWTAHGEHQIIPWPASAR